MTDAAAAPRPWPLIRRRAALLLPALAAARPAAAAEGDYAFRVLRRGDAIGTHQVRFATRGIQRVATSELLIRPAVMGIVVYRYEHIYEEVTEAGRFVSVTSRLNRNGRIMEVRGHATADAVLLDGTAGPARLPPDAAPLSWWEMRRLGGHRPLFGTTTGRAFTLRWQAGRAAAGGPEFTCMGDVEAQVAFDANGRWVGLSAREDGNEIVYAPG
ncbi:hypothetical protein GXW78_18415 [Roseomonas terrae]|uniref:DUF3108 domain-containing protein n=1 Tax=Neoroseomonas terrae TaxID=424799 RepID=A0ABS5EKU8_9PROT|nr:DUF6134 family protein [Neoroseomonas terrae]MBR0651649.1 hypothetical protein [Neoroseomonas terrae]